jgi:hypothetical protein
MDLIRFVPVVNSVDTFRKSILIFLMLKSLIMYPASIKTAEFINIQVSALFTPLQTKVLQDNADVINVICIKFVYKFTFYHST